MNKEIGEAIKFHREQKGLSTTALGKLLGKTSVWVHYLETGQRKIKAEDLQMIGNVIGVPVREFFLDGEGDMATIGLKTGQSVHMYGFPVILSGPVNVRTRKENVKLILDAHERV
jgi:transcriptional regulator with XRE-family HTH domain